jgi:WD40 repeat protein
LEPGGLVNSLDREAPPTTVAFNPAGGVLAVGDDSGFVSIWSVATQRQQLVRLVMGGVITGLAYSPDGARLAVYHRQRVLILDAATLSLLRPFDPVVQTDVFMSETFHDVAYSPDGQWMAILDGRTVIIVETDGYTEASRLSLSDF